MYFKIVVGLIYKSHCFLFAEEIKDEPASPMSASSTAEPMDTTSTASSVATMKADPPKTPASSTTSLASTSMASPAPPASGDKKKCRKWLLYSCLAASN